MSTSSTQPSPNPVSAGRFRSGLIYAIGKEKLENLPQVILSTPTVTSYNLFSESSLVKGLSRDGRLFISIAVENPNYQVVAQERANDVFAALIGRTLRVGVLTIYQRYSNETVHPNYQSWYCNSAPPLATLDPQLNCFITGGAVRGHWFRSLKEIVDGKHPDLKVCTLAQTNILASALNWNLISKKETQLRELGLSQNEIYQSTNNEIDQLIETLP